MDSNVLNPDGASLDIPDVGGYLASLPDGDDPMVDLGGGMVVPLRELVDEDDD